MGTYGTLGDQSRSGRTPCPRCCTAAPPPHSHPVPHDMPYRTCTAVMLSKLGFTVAMWMKRVNKPTRFLFVPVHRCSRATMPLITAAATFLSICARSYLLGRGQVAERSSTLPTLASKINFDGPAPPCLEPVFLLEQYKPSCLVAVDRLRSLLL